MPFLLSAVLLAGLSCSAKPELPKPDADDGAISLPPGFRALVVADDLGRIRFISVATNGDVYIKRTREGLIALRDTDGDGRADVTKTFGTNYGPGTGVCVRGGWLYFSTDNEVFRFPLKPGELVPSGPAERIVTGLPGGRGHSAKAFTFDGEGRLYVEVGCPSNASGNPDRAPGAKGVDPAELFKRHGGFWRFDPDRKDQDQLRDGFHFSSGMRHALSVAWQPVAKSLFVTMMGRDQLNTVDSVHYNAQDNAEKPAEEFHKLQAGSHFGWPFTYWDPVRNVRMIGPEFGGDNEQMDMSGKYDPPLVALPAHWAPMQMLFYGGTQFPGRYRNGAFIAMHGSWNRAPLPQSGYNVVFIPFSEKGLPLGNYFEVFADDFAGIPVIKSPRDAHYRPCGIAEGPDGSLYVADSEKGRVWRIIYTGEKREVTRPVTMISSNLPPGTPDTPASRLYAQTCAVCHMGDGGGVPNMQPALSGSAIVAGDPEQLIRVALLGSKALAADRVKYSNTMPQLDTLSDEQIALVLSYVRDQFGNQSPAIRPEQVRKVRAESSDAKQGAP